jgi:hypothetical protein
LVPVRALVHDGDAKARLYRRLVCFGGGLEVPFGNLVDPYAGGPAHSQGNSGEVCIGRDSRHRIVDELGTCPPLLIGEKHLPLREALTCDVVNAPGVFLGIECKQLVHLPCVGVWKECCLLRDFRRLREEYGTGPDGVCSLRLRLAFVVERTVVETRENKEGSSSGIPRIPCDEKRAAIIRKFERVADGSREGASTRFGGIRPDGDDLDARIVPSNQNEAVWRNDNGTGLVHQHDSPSLLDLAVPLPMNLIQVNLRRARQDSQ